MLRTKAEFSSRLPDDGIEDGRDFVVLPGRNVAEVLREMLSGLGCEVEPVEDAGDHGWSFRFSRGKGEYYCELTIIDGVVAQFDDMSIRGDQTRFGGLLTELSSVLEADPRFDQLGWFTGDEVTLDQAGASSPTGPYSNSPCRRRTGPRLGEEPLLSSVDVPVEAEAQPTTDRVEAVSGAWSDLSPHPIRRWVARYFDGYVTVGAFAAALASPVALSDLEERAAAPLVAAMMVCLIGPVRGLVGAVLNAGLLRWTSTTPGKWLCGIRIVRKDGKPLTFGVALKRELDVFTVGCGLYLPLVAVITQVLGFRSLDKNGKTSWDESHELMAVQRPDSTVQWLLTVIAFVPLLAAVAAMTLLSEFLGQAPRGG